VFTISNTAPNIIGSLVSDSERKQRELRERERVSE